MHRKKIIPRYSILPILLLVIVQFLAYFATQLINKNYSAYDLTLGFIDEKIPLITSFIVFYILCYPWWYLTPLIIARADQERFFNYVVALIISFLISGVIFIFLPTTITRPVIENNNIFDYLTNFIYLADSPTRPINLFPSFHCLISWFCYIGVRRQTAFSLWYRTAAFIFAVLVCLSTQFVKQHYIVDLIAGILIAEAVFFIVRRFNLGKIFKKYKIFGERNDNKTI